MSRKDNDWDNACVESFFRTLKHELVYRRHSRPVKTRDRTSSSPSRCSLIGGAVTRPSAMTPQPSTKRGRR
jgi:transposase InsO family protein